MLHKKEILDKVFSLHLLEDDLIQDKDELLELEKEYQVKLRRARRALDISIKKYQNAYNKLCSYMREYVEQNPEAYSDEELQEYLEIFAKDNFTGFDYFNGKSENDRAIKYIYDPYEE